MSGVASGDAALDLRGDIVVEVVVDRGLYENYQKNNGPLRFDRTHRHHPRAPLSFVSIRLLIKILASPRMYSLRPGNQTNIGLNVDDAKIQQ